MAAITQRRRRYRSAVLWVVAVLASSNVIVSIVVDQSATGVRDPEFQFLHDRLRDRIAERPRQPVAVFVGSSRVAQGFDASRAAGSNDAVMFNFGIPGAGPFLESIAVDRLRDAGVRPDIMFLEVMSPFFNAAGPRSLDHILLDSARLSVGEAAELTTYGNRSKSGPLRRWAYARALPMHRHQAELRDRLGLGLDNDESSPILPCDQFGFRPRVRSPEECRAMTATAHEAYDAFYGEFQMDSQPWARLVATIRCSWANGIHVVCVLMPEGSEFRRADLADGASELIRRLRDEVMVPVIDARDWLPDAAFADQHHLLPASTGEFAERFRIEAFEPALRRVDRRIAGQ